MTAEVLTKRCSFDSVGKLVGALSDAQVDLKPHQIEAVVFAFRSPFSKGVKHAESRSNGPRAIRK
jgi:adenine-specific DNA-methyltransferase